MPASLARPVTWWRRQSLRLRVTAAATAVLALALAASAYVFVAVLGEALVRGIDDQVYQRGREIVALSDANRLSDPVVSSDNTIVQVLDREGRIVDATPNTDRLVPLLPAASREAAVRTGSPLFLDGRPYALPGPLRVRALSADHGVTVIVARSFAEVESSMVTIGHVLIAGMPLLLALLAAVSWLVVGRTLRPIALLRRGAAEVGATARSRRLPVPEARDEVHALATTLNDMLGRLEEADARQRALVSDAAHELRSPLASIRLQLEVALSHPEGQDWTETAEGVLEDTLRLSRLAEDLLALARLDEGRLGRREPVDLVSMARRTAERYGLDLDLGLDLAPSVSPVVASPVVLGDTLDLRRVLANLVDNALRHAASAVGIGVRAEGSVAELTVTDDGPGIRPEDRERVFDRFTRLDDARSRDDGGAGLGLAIVRTTVEAHGGTVHLEDASPGLRAVVRLPLAR
ncbi:sensor histidine kinase [Microbispora bryophytorum]|uniref:histidine kinase n=1 Tax=Microbispora bryophytorum TaxID=1460882 RepID=A0A8H9LIS2_9ACTN|nr:ATP-binding protein [Microbispora bryophytorum]MBD3138493.1 HAMP domain-containing protein [Microbispora bryophytorum]TQS04297.1 HAMP domain-containing protein [Microbispora bryophytorum]GGO24105.1 two-component sensor histidine kinase [Microbispora bryophytorum]